MQRDSEEHNHVGSCCLGISTLLLLSISCLEFVKNRKALPQSRRTNFYIFLLKSLLLFHLRKYITNIPIDADAPVCNFVRTKCLAIIDTSIYSRSSDSCYRRQPGSAPFHWSWHKFPVPCGRLYYPSWRSRTFRAIKMFC